MRLWLFTRSHLVIINATAAEFLTLVRNTFQIVWVWMSLFLFRNLNSLLKGLIFFIRVNIVSLKHVLWKIRVGVLPPLSFVVIHRFRKLNWFFRNLKANEHTFALDAYLRIFMVRSPIVCSIMLIVFGFGMAEFIVSFHESFSPKGQLQMVLKVQVLLSLDLIFVVWIIGSLLPFTEQSLTIKYWILEFQSAKLNVFIRNEVFLGAILPWWPTYFKVSMHITSGFLSWVREGSIR